MDWRGGSLSKSTGMAALTKDPNSIPNIHMAPNNTHLTLE